MPNGFFQPYQLDTPISNLGLFGGASHLIQILIEHSVCKLETLVCAAFQCPTKWKLDLYGLKRHHVI